MTTAIISVVFSVVVVVLVLGFVRRSMSGTKESRERAVSLSQTGSKARATILKLEPTGLTINDINIQCVVHFQLQPIDGGAPFPGQKKMMINQVQAPRPGDVWPAWYDPADPTSFAVGVPDGASAEQVPMFREFGIPHPLDPSGSAAPDAV